VNGNEARGLVPPQPNLGPEPWRDPDGTPWQMPAAVVATVLVLLAAWLWHRRRAALRSRRSAMPAGVLAVADPTPRDRLVGLSESIRDAMTVQFGSSCRAKTTEELAVDEKLAQLLGEESFRELIAFLDRIDLLKFAPERPDNHAGELEELLTTWEGRVTTLDARIRVKPRARQRSVDGRSKPSARGTRPVPTLPNGIRR
jgi:uncharacterized protein (TIGR03382 family)